MCTLVFDDVSAQYSYQGRQRDILRSGESVEIRIDSLLSIAHYENVSFYCSTRGEREWELEFTCWSRFDSSQCHNSAKADKVWEISTFYWPFSYRLNVLMADIRSCLPELNSSAADGNEYDPRNEENNRTYLTWFHFIFIFTRNSITRELTVWSTTAADK